MSRYYRRHLSYVCNGCIIRFDCTDIIASSAIRSRCRECHYAIGSCWQRHNIIFANRRVFNSFYCIFFYYYYYYYSSSQRTRSPLVDGGRRRQHQTFALVRRDDPNLEVVYIQYIGYVIATNNDRVYFFKKKKTRQS